jgi:hypothetical protein
VLLVVELLFAGSVSVLFLKRHRIYFPFWESPNPNLPIPVFPPPLHLPPPAACGPPPIQSKSASPSPPLPTLSPLAPPLLFHPYISHHTPCFFSYFFYFIGALALAAPNPRRCRYPPTAAPCCRRPLVPPPSVVALALPVIRFSSPCHGYHHYLSASNLSPS